MTDPGQPAVDWELLEDQFTAGHTHALYSACWVTRGRWEDPVLRGNVTRRLLEGIRDAVTRSGMVPVTLPDLRILYRLPGEPTPVELGPGDEPPAEWVMVRPMFSVLLRHP